MTDVLAFLPESRVQYFKLLDTTMVQLESRYDQPGIQMYIKLESIIVKPVPGCSQVPAAVQQYSELDGTTLHT